MKGPADVDVLHKLVEEKAPQFVPADGQWRVYLLGFSRSGWSEAAVQFARRSAGSEPPDSNWHVVGTRLVDLKQLDDDLERWSRPAPSNKR